MKRVIAVDFDGVLHSYTSGWQGADRIPDLPVPGAMKWLYNLVESGKFLVAIFSSRNVGGRDAMKSWLHYHLANELGNSDARAQKIIEQLAFPLDKPAAWVTIDDRALCFDGCFANFTPDRLEAFAPWYKRGVNLRDVYKHFKNGKFYEVILQNVVREGSHEKMVVYRPVDGGDTYTRPAKEFFGMVETGGRRFIPVEA